MTDKQIIIDDIDVSELTSEQLVCIDRYDVARLFIKLVETLSEAEDNYNKVQEDRIKMWTDNTDLTEKLKAKEQECKRLKQMISNYKCPMYKNPDRYLQVLMEIKEIVEHEKLFIERLMITGVQKVNVLAYVSTIIQKINEVLND